MAELLDGSAAFTCAGECYGYGDVVRAAQLRGETWPPDSDDPAIRADLGVSGTPDAPTPLDSGELRAGVVALRRGRGLLSAQDYRAWLAVRELDTADVENHVRQLTPVTPEQLRAELILSGRLGEWARTLADAVAVASPAPSGTGRLAAAIAADQRFREELLSPEAIDRVIIEHRHDWQRLRWRELVLDREGAAREAALWIRVDGLDIEDVAGLAHATALSHDALYCDVADARAPLLAATPGQLVGPLLSEGEWRLATLQLRRPADGEDPELRARAERQLLDNALERHRAGRIRWHVEY